LWVAGAEHFALGAGDQILVTVLIFLNEIWHETLSLRCLDLRYQTCAEMRMFCSFIFTFLQHDYNFLIELVMNTQV